MQPGETRETGPFAPGAGPGSYWSSESPQQIIDSEHLRLLRIGYFISAAQTAVFIPFGLLYVGMGVMMSQLPLGGTSGAPSAPGAPSPFLFTWIFGLMGALVSGFALLGAVLKLLTAIRLKERRSRMLCLITAGLSCLEMPYGTALGVFTFIVLGRSSVRQQFEGG